MRINGINLELASKIDGHQLVFKAFPFFFRDHESWIDPEIMASSLKVKVQLAVRILDTAYFFTVLQFRWNPKSLDVWMMFSH